MRKSASIYTATESELSHFATEYNQFVCTPTKWSRKIQTMAHLLRCSLLLLLLFLCECFYCCFFELSFSTSLPSSSLLFVVFGFRSSLWYLGHKTKNGNAMHILVDRLAGRCKCWFADFVSVVIIHFNTVYYGHSCCCCCCNDVFGILFSSLFLPFDSCGLLRRLWRWRRWSQDCLLFDERFLQSKPIYL